MVSVVTPPYQLLVAPGRLLVASVSLIAQKVLNNWVISSSRHCARRGTFLRGCPETAWVQDVLWRLPCEKHHPLLPAAQACMAVLGVMPQSGFEPPTFRLIAKCANLLCHRDLPTTPIVNSL